MQTTSTKVIGKTFQKISDLVTPTMGAKGRLAVLPQDMDCPLLTDDGVTVARQALSLKGFERLPAVSLIEGANNTEKEAYDGTTLTVLMTNELYKFGTRLIKFHHYHPQEAADEVERFASFTRYQLERDKYPLTPDLIPALSLITTKIPAIGELVQKAYDIAGNNMNVVIEHAPKDDETVVEHTKGLILNSGFDSEVMQAFNTEDGKTIYQNSKLVLLSEGILTAQMIKGFFQSLPEKTPPLVFFIPKNFNPESLKMLLDVLVRNQASGLKFQFVFLNEDYSEELFLDIASYTNGHIQDAALGTSNYLFKHCGSADNIIIEKNKTTIVASGDVSERVKTYQAQLDDKEKILSINKEAMIRRRLSNLTTGLVKIKLSCATVTEYLTIKMKLDDAIGAVRCACRQGVLPGCGRALLEISYIEPKYKKILQAPMKNILKNAGLEKSFRKLSREGNHKVIDVKSKEYGNAFDLGIIDGFASIDTAIKNAASIASNYLRAYIVVDR